MHGWRLLAAISRSMSRLTLPASISRDGRQHHAFLKHFRCLTVARAGNGAADVGLVRNRSSKSDQRAIDKDGRHDRHVRRVRHKAFVGMIADEYIAVRQVFLAENRYYALRQMIIGGRVIEHRRRCDQPAFRIDNDAGKIAAFAHDGRIAGPKEMMRHFFHQAGNAIAQDLHGDGIDSGLCLFGMSRSCSQPFENEIQILIATHVPAVGHDGC